MPKKKLFIVRAGMFLFVLGVSLLSGRAEAETRSWWTEVFPSDIAKQTKITKQAQDLATYVNLSPDDPFHKKVDVVRNFIFSNSVHNIDAEFYSYWHDVPKLMTMMAGYAKDNESYKPHFECSSRTAVMYWLLKAYDVRSRMIVVYPAEDVDKSHTYLEVYNPETKKWEIQDPDFNLYWIFSETKERASTKDLLTYPLEETFLPCTSPDDCAYSKRVKNILDRFALASIIDIDTDYHPLLVNPVRFNPEHPFIKNEPKLPYCQLFKDKCYQDVIELENKESGDYKNK